jgi:SAM-dependent methyltransferase
MTDSASPYDRIGRTYSRTRRTDPRIQAQILHALGDAGSVVNVGAGTGAYEPADREVLAVEPSAVLLRQRAPGAAPAVQASAESLPLPDGSVDAAMAILTVHHWRDLEQGIRELRRVARRRIVILTFDPAMADAFWLVRDYLPAIARHDDARCPAPATLASLLGASTVTPVPVPADCEDGFFAAFWRRPHAYLDETVRAGISYFDLLDPAELAEGLEALRRDLDAGRWHERNAALLELGELDVGYRLLVAELG